MERPTSALQGAGYAVRGPLNAEPHTNEVGLDRATVEPCQPERCGLIIPTQYDIDVRVVTGDATANPLFRVSTVCVDTPNY